MLIIRPQAISASNLTLSNIVETAPAVYNAGTNYGLGAQAYVAGGISNSTAMLYESLQAGNVGHTPASSPDWWMPIGITYLVWNAGTNYATGARVNDNTNHLVYESLVDGNLNHAVTDPAFWGLVGPTNKFAMFDDVNGTVTTHPTEIDVTMTFTGRVDSVALVNMSNVISVQIIVSTIADGTLYDETFSTVSTDGIGDWYDYFFEEIVQQNARLITGLPVNANPTIRAILTGSGTADMYVGSLVVGLSKNIGETTREGASVGITDYSRKEVDDWGSYQLMERAFSKRGTFRLAMPKNSIDEVYRILSQYRATPIVYSAADEFASTLIFGFFKDFSIGFEYDQTSFCNIEVEGLT